MVYQGKFNIVGTQIAACDYSYIVKQIELAIKKNKRLLISPIASQTLVHAKNRSDIRGALAIFDFLVPDSEWIKKSLNLLYRTTLKKRVYGPNLMLEVCSSAVLHKWKIFLYGTNTQTLKRLKKRLHHLYPGLLVVAAYPSKYRKLQNREVITLKKQIITSRADIVFIGTGSPQQEVLTKQLISCAGKLNKIIIPEGAAFDFISQVKSQAPEWMQNNGLEWLFRLVHEPFRLWYRYLIIGPYFALLLCRQYITQKLGILQK